MQHPFQTPSPPAPSTVVNKKRSEHVLQTPVGQIYRTDPISAIQTQKVDRPPVSSPTNSVCSEASTTSTDSVRIKKKKPVKVVSSKFMQGTTSSATPMAKPLPKREKESVRTVRPPRLPPSNGDCPIPKKPEKKTDMKPPATVTRTASLRPRQPSDASTKPSGTFTRTPSLQRLRSSTASTKPEPETTEPSPETTRRVPAAPSSQAAEICFDDNEAEIEVLQARLLQWNFINGRATQAFEAQKRQVEVITVQNPHHLLWSDFEFRHNSNLYTPT
ncbi:hypothetical protein K7432_016990 [Basidiobolus ranarum]|uniref:Uncharacterized protein n=1 Tax=Basidiobolus ranarum TaxID=34480 RepID=A0ABR2VKW7_9FUNG